MNRGPGQHISIAAHQWVEVTARTPPQATPLRRPPPEISLVITSTITRFWWASTGYKRVQIGAVGGYATMEPLPCGTYKEAVINANLPALRSRAHIRSRVLFERGELSVDGGRHSFTAFDPRAKRGVSPKSGPCSSRALRRETSGLPFLGYVTDLRRDCEGAILKDRQNITAATVLPIGKQQSL
jgi:hypothetical protein